MGEIFCMKHMIFTRCNFFDDSLFLKYFEVMKLFYIPSLKSQINKNFDLYIDTNPNFPNHRLVIAEQFLDSEIYLSFDTLGMRDKAIQKNYEIQTRHDCDDYMSQNYVQEIQKTYNENIEKFDAFIIHAQPVIKYLKNGKEQNLPPYTSKRVSMFSSLCQKKCKNYVMDTSHGELWTICPTVIDLGDGFVKWISHSNNISNTKK